MSSRSSFSPNFTVALRILAIFALLIPVKSVLNRVFDGTWDVDWRLQLYVGATLAVAILVIFGIAEVLDSRVQANVQSNRMVFVGSTLIRGLYAISMLMGVGLPLGCYIEGDPWWVVTLPAVFLLMGYIAWPYAIQISDGEIRQKDWLLRIRRIPLTDIVVVTFDPARGNTIVFGRNGARIVHTSRYLGTDQFVEELTRRTGKPVSNW